MHEITSVYPLHERDDSFPRTTVNKIFVTSDIKKLLHE